ncbi:hypothetical protein C5167_044258 [Papaver somniferum]|uniref:Auxin-responsive protein n=1 Tax=Papaver somniferum TaxID=3469 RepID=A0A4Y7LBX0_PAPSO|nr:auxin-responsive protein IAA2-like [Papaver somniferum]RZC81695.1 hypothetical protein C5167_044258 [Papaver somniferum]
MEGGSSSEQYHQWMLRENHDFAEEKKLELTLGPPGDDQVHHHHQVHNYMNSSGTHNYSNQNLSFPWCSNSSSTTPSGPSPIIFHTQQKQYLDFAAATPQQNLCAGCSEKAVELQNNNKTDNNKACFAAATPAAATITAANNSISQKRTSTTAAAAPVVGWPPIRSYRKNLSNSATKQVAELEKGKMPKENCVKPPENCRRKGLFVKINMDGVPIGRKVDIDAYDSYDKLSFAVDELFRSLLAAERDTSSCGIHNKKVEVKAITGLLDCGGEYTLVYEDNEGDRMLVGDVPWDMFASTVKRLRVLKSSELSTLCLCSSKQDSTIRASAVK